MYKGKYEKKYSIFAYYLINVATKIYHGNQFFAIIGSGAVHLVGGSSAFVASWMLGPRLGRWDIDGAPPMGSPTNALVGLFMLWWGWLAFNAGR